jgi:hypothetical protein
VDTKASRDIGYGMCFIGSKVDSEFDFIEYPAASCVVLDTGKI